MDIQIETQDVEIPPHSSRRLNSLIRKAMDRAGLQIARLHLSLRDVNGRKGGQDKLCTMRATLVTGGEVVVIDRSTSLREGLVRALRRSRSMIRRELLRRRQRARKTRFSGQTSHLDNEASPA